mgnify:CR=1 FL=1
MKFWKASQQQLDDLHEVLDLIQSSCAVPVSLEARLEKAIWGLQLVPLKDLNQQYKDYAIELSRKLGKPILWESKDSEFWASPAIREALSKALVHGVRNALDHGIETAEERKTAGKSAQAKLSLSIELARCALHVQLSDDGRGPQWDAIQKQAQKMGWKDPDANLNILFEPGFSTQAQANDVSGRGIGLDAVREAFLQLGGQVSAGGKTGQGFTLDMHLPVDAIALETVILDFGSGQFCVPTDALQELRGRLATVKSHGFFQQLGWNAPENGVFFQIYGEPVRVLSASQPELRHFRLLDSGWSLAGPEWMRRWMTLNQGKMLGCSYRKDSSVVSSSARQIVPLMDRQSWMALNTTSARSPEMLV